MDLTYSLFTVSSKKIRGCNHPEAQTSVTSRAAFRLPSSESLFDRLLRNTLDTILHKPLPLCPFDLTDRHLTLPIDDPKVHFLNFHTPATCSSPLLVSARPLARRPKSLTQVRLFAFNFPAPRISLLLKPQFEALRTTPGSRCCCW